MKCTKCGEPLGNGATFCGNCGQPVAQPVVGAAPVAPVAPTVVQPNIIAPAGATPAAPPPVSSSMPTTPAELFAAPAMTPSPAGAMAATPAYAMPVVAPGGGKAIAAMVLGIIGLIVWLVPIAGLIVGILAIVFGTMSMKSAHHGMALAGVITGSLAILLSLGAFIYNVQHLTSTSSGGGLGVTSGSTQLVSTSCFATKVDSTLKVTTGSGCAVSVSQTGTNNGYIFKSINVAGLTQAKLSAAAEPDVKNLLTTIGGNATVTDEKNVTFAGSPAVQFDFSDAAGDGGRAAYVLHTASANNLAIIYKFTSTKTTDLSDVESSWQWK